MYVNVMQTNAKLQYQCFSRFRQFSPLWGRHSPTRALAASVGRSQHEAKESSQPKDERHSETASADAVANRKGVKNVGSKKTRGQRLQEPRRLQALQPRLIALQQLMRIEREGAYAGLVNGSPDSHDSEDNAGRADRLSPRDQRVVKELVSGVTRWRRRLDYIISELCKKPTSALEPAVRQVLRLAIYELALCKAAPYAVNEHVELVKLVERPAAVGAAVGFVNGVLRAVVRRMEDDMLPTPEMREGEGSSGRDLVRTLAIAGSHPNWMVVRWLKRFGADGTKQLMAYNNRAPVYGIRVNPLRQITVEKLLQQLQELGVKAQASELLPQHFLRVSSGLQTLLAQGYVSQGNCFVQDESAGLVVHALDPQPGERLLDCCAAPGGKTMYAATRMQGQGHITALDVSASRLTALRNMAEATGLAGMITPVAQDLRDFASTAEPASYDKVLLDAPCSGTGVLAKRADMRWRRQAEDLLKLTQLQDQLLDAAALLVRPGGVLVYSTCSIEPDEDSQRVEAFLARHPAFVLESLAGPLQLQLQLQQGLPVMPAAVVTAEGYLSTLPHEHGMDGAFAARMRRLPQS